MDGRDPQQQIDLGTPRGREGSKSAGFFLGTSK